jgi:hypothetical protein
MKIIFKLCQVNYRIETMQKSTKHITEIGTVTKVQTKTPKQRLSVNTAGVWVVLGLWVVVLTGLNESMFFKEILTSITIIACLLILKAIDPKPRTSKSSTDRTVLQ